MTADAGLAELLGAFQQLQGHNIRMANALSTRLGLGATDMRVLLYLQRTPDSSPKELATQLEQATGSVTALMDRLERSGHVQRSPHPSDRRSLLLNLTPLGRAAVESLRGAYRDAFAAVFAADELPAAVAVLRTLGGALAVAAGSASVSTEPEFARALLG